MQHDGGDGDGDAAAALLMHATLWRVAVTGLSLGIVHVLTGPDHLSALVALCSGQPWTKSMALGVQWGCGHALGILVVAGVCLSLGHALDFSDGVRDALNYLIGLFLVAIGAWTYYHARIEYMVQTKPPSNWDSVQCTDASYTLLSADDNDDAYRKMHPFTSHSPEAVNTMQRTTSICVGLVHGIAGPGGVLGVLPVIAMHNSLGRAALYLGCFCGSSIACMGAFAAIYGEATRRTSASSAVVGFRVAVVSSAISILVGVTWIILQACGVLESVFGHHH